MEEEKTRAFRKADEDEKKRHQDAEKGDDDTKNRLREQ